MSQLGLGYGRRKEYEEEHEHKEVGNFNPNYGDHQISINQNPFNSGKKSAAQQRENQRSGEGCGGNRTARSRIRGGFNAFGTTTSTMAEEGHPASIHPSDACDFAEQHDLLSAL